MRAWCPSRGRRAGVVGRGGRPIPAPFAPTAGVIHAPSARCERAVTGVDRQPSSHPSLFLTQLVGICLRCLSAPAEPPGRIRPEKPAASRFSALSTLLHKCSRAYRSAPDRWPTALIHVNVWTMGICSDEAGCRRVCGRHFSPGRGPVWALARSAESAVHWLAAGDQVAGNDWIALAEKYC